MRHQSDDPAAAQVGTDVTPTAPRQLVQRDDLSREDKIALLREWEQDLREQMVAEEENMTGSSALASDLSDILAALEELHAERPAGAPTKHG